jgi:hypothetical protein
LLKERIKQMGRPQGFIGPSEERVSFEDLAALVQTDYAINDRRSADKLPCRLAHLHAAFAHDRAVDITTDLIYLHRQSAAIRCRERNHQSRTRHPQARFQTGRPGQTPGTNPSYPHAPGK